MVMHRVFKTRHFARWARKAGLPDATLCAAVQEMAAGLVDADLGGGVLKKRVALPGRGKRGSTRTLVATNKVDRWFFLYGYEKNEQENIEQDDLRTVQRLAADYLALDDNGLQLVIRINEIMEICNGQAPQPPA